MNNASAKALKLQLLGNPQFFYGGELLTDLRIQKAQALLIYVVVEAILHPNKGIAKEKLVDLLWPGMPLGSALQNLRQTLYQVRKALPEVPGTTKEKAPLLLTNRKMVRLHPEVRVETDLDALLKHEEGSKEVLSLDGVFLENFYVPECEEYEVWVEEVRNLVRDSQIRALRRQIDGLLTAGNSSEAVAAARRLVLMDPLDETAHLRLMQALYEKGNRTEALRIYRQYQQRLQEELGAKPGAELEEWYEKIKERPENPPRHQVLSSPKTVAGKKKRFRMLGLVATLTMLILLGWYIGRQNTSAISVDTDASIAVLPFENFSDQDYLAEGLVDDIITQLSYVHDLRVISGLSSLQYRDSDKPARQIGEELNVAYLLKGSVQKVNDQVKVNVQLIHAPSNSQQWGTSVTRSSGELFSIQHDITREITGALQISLDPQEEGRLEQPPTENPQAYEEFLQGRFHLYQDLYAALEHFEKAVALDTGFVGAYEYMAHAYVDLAGGWGDQSILDTYPKIKALLQRTEDRPFYPDVRYEAQAWVYMWFYQLDTAEYYLWKAIEANPNSEWALPTLSLCLSFQGKFEEAIRRGQHATASNPMSPYSQQALAIAHMLAGNHQEAHEHGQKALALHPYHVHSFKILAQNYTLQGKYQEAIDLLSKAMSYDQVPDREPFLLGRLGVAYALNGDREEAEEVLTTMLEEYTKKRRHFDYFIAMTYESLGETERALGWLDSAFTNMENELIWVHQDPEFAGLRNHSRYQILAGKMMERSPEHLF